MILRLTPTGRVIRVLAGSVGLALLLLGTWRGSDDHFPFGPFRMFALGTPPSGLAKSTYVEGRDASGKTMRVTDAATGLRRAELEGQLPRIIASPELLGDLTLAHRRRRPDAPRLVELWVAQRQYQLVGGRIVGHRDAMLARWPSR